MLSGPYYSRSNTRFRLTDGLKHLSTNSIVSVKVNKYKTNTDESVLSPSELNNTVSGIPGVSDFLSDEVGSTFFKRLRLHLVFLDRSIVSKIFGYVSFIYLIILPLMDPLSRNLSNQSFSIRLLCVSYFQQTVLLDFSLVWTMYCSFFPNH